MSPDDFLDHDVGVLAFNDVRVEIVLPQVNGAAEMLG